LRDCTGPSSICGTPEKLPPDVPKFSDWCSASDGRIFESTIVFSATTSNNAHLMQLGESRTRNGFLQEARSTVTVHTVTPIRTAGFSAARGRLLFLMAVGAFVPSRAGVPAVLLHMS